MQTKSVASHLNQFVTASLGIASARADGTASSVPLPASAQGAGEATTTATTGTPAATGTSAQPGPMGMLGTLLPFGALFVILYFTSIRPQQKRMKEQQSFQSSLKVGDEVITQAGMVGKLTSLNESFVTLEVDDQVRVKMLRAQVSQRLQDWKGSGTTKSSATAAS